MAIGRKFDEFEVGQEIKHPLSKTIFESDNNLFCLLTMNSHPIHIDEYFAGHSVHKQILVVGTLVFSLIVGMTVQDISGQAIANLEYANINHLRPVHLGDTLHAKSIIRDKIKQNTTGVVRIETTGYNQLEEMVITFNRSILLKL